MGLDLHPIGRAKAGQGRAWSDLTTRLCAGEKLTAAEEKRLLDISIPPYADIGAPVVGKDAAANEWLLKQAHARGDKRADAEIIAEHKGYCVLELLHGKSDGVAVYSNSMLGSVDETSFRGEFLKDCIAILDRSIIDLAWRPAISPNDAIAYGQLLRRRLGSDSPQPPSRDSFVDALLNAAGNIAGARASLQEQRQIVDAASRWYVFWGKHGNPIWADF